MLAFISPVKFKMLNSINIKQISILKICSINSVKLTAKWFFWPHKLPLKLLKSAVAIIAGLRARSMLILLLLVSKLPIIFLNKNINKTIRLLTKSPIIKLALTVLCSLLSLSCARYFAVNLLTVKGSPLPTIVASTINKLKPTW